MELLPKEDLMKFSLVANEFYNCHCEATTELNDELQLSLVTEKIQEGVTCGPILVYTDLV